MSTDVEGWITVERAAQGEWARITMAREPVNSMNYAFWKRLTDVLHTCEQAPDIRGVIFCRCAVACAAASHCELWMSTA